MTIQALLLDGVILAACRDPQIPSNSTSQRSGSALCPAVTARSRQWHGVRGGCRDSLPGLPSPRGVRERGQAVVKAWIMHGDLGAQVADGETGRDVAARVTRALTEMAASHAHRPAIVVGHVASRTTGISVLCHNGARLWGSLLPQAVPFPSAATARTGSAGGQQHPHPARTRAAGDRRSGPRRSLRAVGDE